MSRTGRGKTHQGNPAVVPNELYDPPAAPVEAGDGMTVRFAGDDGRTADQEGMSVSNWYLAESCHSPAMLRYFGATPKRTNPLRSSTRCEATL
jgi:hypothetical protein